MLRKDLGATPFTYRSDKNIRGEGESGHCTYSSSNPVRNPTGHPTAFTAVPAMEAFNEVGHLRGQLTGYVPPDQTPPWSTLSALLLS